VASYFWHPMDETHPQYTEEVAKQYGGAMLKYHQHIDRVIGDLQEAAGPETVLFIVSDHGMGPLYKDVFLNEWLRQEGFLVLKSNPAQYSFLRNLGVTRSRVGRILSSWGIRDLGERIKIRLGTWAELVPGNLQPELNELVDWSATTAYSSGYNGQIYLNVQGRDPQGVVAPGDEYESVRQMLIDRLHTWIDPADGKPVVSAVYKKEELYHGPFLTDAPDLLILMRDGGYITHGGYEFSPDGRIFSEPLTHQSGSHRLNGLLLAEGPMIRHTDKLVAEIHDVAPTILYTLGATIPDDLDGHIIQSLFNEDYYSTHPIKKTGEVLTSDTEPLDWSAEDEKEVIERLRQLGYLQ
jgi:predicted AlkP superfamily phosphohydrolase/phosphomutase